MDTITTIQNLLMSNGSARPVTVALTPSEMSLIAAAPELYAALAGLLDVLGEYAGWRNTAAHEPRETIAENKARAALALARGETT